MERSVWKFLGWKLRGKIFNEKYYNFSSRLRLYLMIRYILMKYYE